MSSNLKEKIINIFCFENDWSRQRIEFFDWLIYALRLKYS